LLLLGLAAAATIAIAFALGFVIAPRAASAFAWTAAGLGLRSGWTVAPLGLFPFIPLTGPMWVGRILLIALVGHGGILEKADRSLKCRRTYCLHRSI
jgi:hypothetical protein